MATLRFKGLYFLGVAVLIRLLLILPPLQARLIEPVIGDLRYGGLLYIFSLLMVLLTLLSNVHLSGFKVLAAGMASNFLVIAANFGQMPGPLEKLTAAGYSGPIPGYWSNFKVINENTPLWFLGDNFLIGHPWPLPSVLSFGDLLIIVGAFWFFQRVMK
ncbi:MAG: DUF5317 family protein [Dehalococcoidia bacterium]|nr:DUF5317 family protein [Dehalococcoidia bacterium]